MAEVSISDFDYFFWLHFQFQFHFRGWWVGGCLHLRGLLHPVCVSIHGFVCVSWFGVGNGWRQDDESFADAWTAVVKPQKGAGRREAPLGGGKLPRQLSKEQAATAQFVEKFKAAKAAKER